MRVSGREFPDRRVGGRACWTRSQTIALLIPAARCGADKMETTNGKRSAKGQSRGPKTEIREAESVGRTGHPVPRKVGHGRGDKTTRQEITVGACQTISSSVAALKRKDWRCSDNASA